jgi:hypothetical protein
MPDRAMQVMRARIETPFAIDQLAGGLRRST